MKRQLKRIVKGGLRRIRALSAPSGSPAGSPLPCRFNIDTPMSGELDEKRVSVSGWLIPDDGVTVHAMRVRHNDITQDLAHGAEREDVRRAFPDRGTAALHSGFSTELDATDGLLTIEIDFGSGFRKLYEIELHYAPEKLVRDYYNPDLALRAAEHQNLLENRKRYFYEAAPGADRAYKRGKTDPRLVAFYLPQFHPIIENDIRWGKGFSEWGNVTGAHPRFVGHQQPLLPKDLGFYDLRHEDTIAEQVEMARQHGIYGFCFYYYWFSGHRVLERPIDSFVNHKEWDFNYMICWANENWTKQWDGSNRNVYLAQQYHPDDPLKFIKDVEHILLDPRYIRQDGKPVLMVYRPKDLKEPTRYAEVWREYFKKHHNLALHLVSVMSFDQEDPKTFGFDMAVDFPPQTTFFKNECFADGRYPYMDVKDRLLDLSFQGMVADYRALARNNKLYDFFDFPTYKSVIPGWDNDPRQNRRGRGFVSYNVNPDLYGHWLDKVIARETSEQPSPLIFLNAWNEWGEGAVLEPSQAYGRAILNRTTQVLSRYSSREQNRTQFPLYDISRDERTKLAVVIHLYYADQWSVIQKRLAVLGDTPHDLFISINEKDSDVIDVIKTTHPTATISIVPNRGRDVLPFVHIARRLSQAGYEHILKLHTKKSKHRTDGSQWFDELLGSLLPSKHIVADILKTLSKEATIIGPSGHFVSLERHMGSDEPHVRRVLHELIGEAQTKRVISHAAEYGFFGGTMFWINVKAIQPILDLYLMSEDFESESGQIDGTFAHGIERVLSVLPQANGTALYRVSSEGIAKLSAQDIETDYQFAP